MLVSLSALVALLAVTGDGLPRANGQAQAKTNEIKFAAVSWSHDGPVSALAWSPDGKTLASAGGLGHVRLTDTRTGKLVDRLNPVGAVAGLVFSPSGKLLGATSGAPDGRLDFWDLDAPEKPGKQASLGGYSCETLAFTPDETALAAVGPSHYMIWSQNGRLLSGFGESSPRNFRWAAISADATTVVRCNAKGLVQLQLRFPADKPQSMQLGPTRVIALSRDARFLAASGEDHTIRLWTIRGVEIRDTETRKFEGLKAAATLLHFSASGKVLAAAAPDDPMICLWDTDSGCLRRRVRATPLGIGAIALSPDGRKLAVGCGTVVNIWNAATRDLGDLGPAKAATDSELKSLWDELAGADRIKADAAFRRLAQARHHSLAFLTAQVRAVAVPLIDKKRVSELLKELDDPIYAVRQSAASELAKLGEAIKGDIEEHAKAKLSLESERRARNLLGRLPNLESHPHRLRCLDAIELFEILNTAQSRDALRELARDSLIPQIRRAAEEALERLAP
ncbi:MAG: PD40 domain-containing protein [Planctomycetes bacterium]|nr:PD40 domain-containing protein [Planctomycetota bacterium]